MEIVLLVLLLVVAAGAQEILYRRLSFRHFHYTCSFSVKEATEGDEIRLIETVTNRKLLPIPWLRSEISTSQWLDYAGTQSQVTDGTRFVASFFTMGSYQRIVRSWNVTCLRRGIYPVGKCTLRSANLLGRSGSTLPVKAAAELTVLPKPADLRAALVSTRRPSGEAVVRRHFIEDPFYTAGVREYTPRDPLNRIHWPATARQGRIMVHNDLYTADQNLLVLLNVQSRSYEGDLVTDTDTIETAIRLCAGFFEDTLVSGIPVRFAANADPEGGREPVVTNEYYGPEHVLDLMRLLARLPLRSCEPFYSFLDHAAGLLEASDIVLITAYVTEEILAFVRKRTSRGIRVRIVCLMPLDTAAVPEDLEVWCLTGEGAGA